MYMKHFFAISRRETKYWISILQIDLNALPQLRVYSNGKDLEVDKDKLKSDELIKSYLNSLLDNQSKHDEL